MAGKKLKKAGDRVIWRLREDESPLIIDWLNQQSNISDAIRLLIEKDVSSNGIRVVSRESDSVTEDVELVEPLIEYSELTNKSDTEPLPPPPSEQIDHLDSFESKKKKKRKRRILV
ncbi:hypothetical protein [Niallia taxi]|uniref:hypothetical protein n=1 Tax=Niallia taxi TaxID=2499688 RepID=UPI0015F5026C|nr:hypothetical protein [Niallia taxi]